MKTYFLTIGMIIAGTNMYSMTIVSNTFAFILSLGLFCTGCYIFSKGLTMEQNG